MNDVVVLLPLLVPALTAAGCLVAWRRTGVQRLLGVGGAAVHLASAILLLARVMRDGPLSTQGGGWDAPFGITLVADLLSALMVLLAALMGFTTAVYSVPDIDRAQRRLGYFGLLHLLLMGVCGAFLTGDLFNLYVWFEVMLMASFVLIALGGHRPQMEGALKYVTLNLVSSAFFLAAVGIVYAATRTLNLADLVARIPELARERPRLVEALAGLFLAGFGIKAALFPFYFWLPASYHTPPAAVSAFFAGLLTKVGVYALIRVFVLLFPALPHVFVWMLLLAGFTMVLGVLGAYSQFEIRRILSFHIVSQIGYMVLGLGLLASRDPSVQRLGLAAAIFYVAHHIVVKTNLFLLGGTVRALRGTYRLDRLGGLARATPLLAILFLVPAASLAGIPPLSGFWAKLAILRAALAAGEGLLVGAALFAGLLTLLSMVKIWNEAFWKAVPEGEPDGVRFVRRREGVARLLPIALLAAVTVAIGLFPGPLFALAERAADQLLAPAEYLRAVGVAGAAGGPGP